MVSPTRQAGIAGWVAALLLGTVLTLAAPKADAGDAPSADASAERAARKARLVELIEEAIAGCTPGAVASVAGDSSLRTGASGAFVAPRTVRLNDKDYPIGELLEGNQAMLVMSYLVDAMGNPRFVHVDRQITNSKSFSGFSSRTIKMFRSGTFLPGTQGGRPVAVWRRTAVTYIVAMGQPGSIFNEDQIKKDLKNARAGDVPSQLMISFLDSVAPVQIKLDETERRHYLAVAAVSGGRSALLRVAQLLGRRDCKAPEDAELFIHLHAMSGKSDLELFQATRLLQRPNPESNPDISPMLHGAAHADDAFVQLWAAGILATTPIATLRDPGAALEVARSMDVKDDPDAGEMLAAALAANGQYADAVREESAAIEAARKLHWTDTLMAQRLAQYAAGKPWIGYLCDCDQLVPGGGL
jgi:hypothetical protein